MFLISKLAPNLVDQAKCLVFFLVGEDAGIFELLIIKENVVELLIIME